MNWANSEWAARHIMKHAVTVHEAWQVFAAAKVKLRSQQQPNHPVCVRYWTIGLTEEGRKLLVVWERKRALLNLITAFEPNLKQEAFYAFEKKNQRAKG